MNNCDILPSGFTHSISRIFASVYGFGPIFEVRIFVINEFFRLFPLFNTIYVFSDLNWLVVLSLTIISFV